MALVPHLPSLQPAQLGPGTAHCTCQLNGDSWPERDQFAAWLQGEQMRRVPRWPGRRSWARPRQQGSKDMWRPADKEPETLSWGWWAQREGFQGRRGGRPVDERGAAGEGGGR